MGTQEVSPMIVVPIESKDHMSDALIIVLDCTQVERMGHADPAEVVLSQFGRTLVNPIIMIAHERSDNPDLTRICQQVAAKLKSPLALAEYLQRGRQFRPDLGDHDNGPRKIGGDQ